VSPEARCGPWASCASRPGALAEGALEGERPASRAQYPMTNNEPVPDRDEDRFPCRRRPAHPAPVHRHNRPTILHVTVCTARRAEILARVDVHEGLRVAWSRTRQWLVGYYLVMPDHVHLFCAPGVHDPEHINDWLAYWKRLAGDELTGLRSAWQADGWDTQMRTQDHYMRKLEYVAENPVRKRLVARSEDWPYQGRLHTLPWIAG
jgi:putative transposase